MYHAVLSILFTRELQARLTPTERAPIVVCVNPGYCATCLRRPASTLARAAGWVGDRLLARSAEEGSRQLVWGAVGVCGDGDEDQSVRLLRGVYVSRSAVCAPSEYVASTEGMRVQLRIWVRTSFISACATVVIGAAMFLCTYSQGSNSCRTI